VNGRASHHAEANGVAIRVRDLAHRYAGGGLALADASFDIHVGERVALLGPNGAGKSTLLRHLIGLLQPAAGGVEIMGTAVVPAHVADVRRRVGFVFQDPDDQLFCPTVLEDVAFGPLHLGIPVDEVVDRARHALDKVGMPGFEQRVPHKLSGGEKRLVALATVLSYDAEILVLDEPGAGLDPRNRRRLVALLREMGGTQLLATHDLDLAWDVCDRAILLNGGRVAADGPARDILADSALLERCHLELPLRLQGHA
jgi:cobalt/nickel transport system ATP-binding protein